MHNQIRPIVSADLELLTSVFVRSYAHTDEKWNDQTAYAYLSNWFKRQPDLVFVAELDGKVIGAAMVAVRPWWDGNHLIDGEFFVDPSFRKRAVAKALLRHLLKEAIEKYAPVHWDTWTFRAEEFPLHWYKKIGFKEIEEWIMIRANVENLNATINQFE